MTCKLKKGLLLTLAFAAMACAPNGSKESGTATAPSSSEVSSEAQYKDQFTFRDANTNEVLSEEAVPGRLMNAQYTYMSGTPKKWANGVIKWWYNPNGQPTMFNSQQAVDALIAASKRWEQVCNVSFQYQGMTTNQLNITSCNGATVVGWTPLAGSVIGQTQDCFSNSTIGEMDLALDNSQIDSLTLMQTVAVHEMGHAFGLGHTDLATAVMTPYLTTGFPVQDDIQGCQSLYGVPSTTSTPAPVCTAGATQSCSVSNGTGKQVCAPDGSAWGSCAAVTCNSGYTLSNGACVSNTTSSPLICQPNTQYTCSSFTGTGYRTCNAKGTRLSNCQITACKAGYQMSAGVCRRIR